VVAEQQARMEPYICGINPSRLNVKAHQHSVVMPIIKVVERKTGYDAVTTCVFVRNMVARRIRVQEHQPGIGNAQCGLHYHAKWSLAY
jgi:hypothetical protein